MSKLPKAGVGNSNINVFFASTVTAGYWAYLIVHSIIVTAHRRTRTRVIKSPVRLDLWE